MSVVVFFFIGILMVSELMYYRGTEMKYTYEVDKDAERSQLTLLSYDVDSLPKFFHYNCSPLRAFLGFD